MKPTYLAPALLAMVAVAQGMAVPTDQQVDSSQVSAVRWINEKSIVFGGHRGCWESAPENSLEGLANCEASGIKAIEGDIHTTKDGTLVWIHDDTLDRTTNSSGRVSDHTYSELRAARLKLGTGGRNAVVTDQTIPKLRDVLNASSKLVVILDVKESNYDEVFNEVEAAHAEKRVIFLAYGSPAEIRAARFLHKSAFIPALIQCHPQLDAPYCYSAEDLTSGRAFKAFEDLTPIAYWPAVDDSIADQVASVSRKAGLRIADTPDGEIEAKTPAELMAIWSHELRRNVTIFVTNRPSQLKKYLNSLK